MDNKTIDKVIEIIDSMNVYIGFQKSNGKNDKAISKDELKAKIEQLRNKHDED